MEARQDFLIQRLDAFIRKYYRNQLLRGALFSLALLGSAFILLSLSEFFGRFPTAIRAVLFFGFVGMSGYVLLRYIITPLLKLYRIGKVISYEEAALIVGRHFPEVSDKLLNTLQLQQMQQGGATEPLLEASIRQKTEALRPVRFTAAINFRENRKLARYAAVPAALIAIILLFQSSVFTEGTRRLIEYRRQFKQEAPFRFVLYNKNLRVQAGASLELVAGLEGKTLPDELSLLLDGREINMTRRNDGRFVYRFEELRAPLEFNLGAAGFFSDPYRIETIQVASLNGLSAALEYPSYVGLKNETREGFAELQVPEGTWINWTLKTAYTDAVQVQLPEGAQQLASKDARGWFSLKKRALKSGEAVFIPSNSIAGSRDSVKVLLRVIPDAYPQIRPERNGDSGLQNQIWFRGSASDDYGVSRILFHYRFTRAGMAGKMNLPTQSIPVNVPQGRDVAFVHGVNLSSLGMEPGDEVEYFFEVWDNDGVHGSKATRSSPETLRKAGLDELRKEVQEGENRLDKNMQAAMQQMRKQQKNEEELRRRMAEQRQMNWEDQERARKHIEEQLRMQDQIMEIRKQQEQLSRQQQETNRLSEELLQREQEVRKLFEELANPELKELLEKLKEQLKQMDKDELQKQMQQMQLNRQDLQKQLEAAREQFKQLQVEKKAEDLAGRLDELAQKQKELSEKTAAQPKPDESLKQQQDQLKNQLEQIQQEQEQLRRDNEELEQPMDLDQAGSEQQQAGEQMQQASDQMKSGKGQQAASKQRSAADKLKEAADKMRQSLAASRAQRNEEDYQTLRQLLENLIALSFKQEQVMQDMKEQREYSPRYVALAQEQKRIQEEANMIADSLFALSKRQIAVQSFINKEVNRINSNLEQALARVRTRDMNFISTRQQYAMTGMNNLAVMLSESMQKMQQQMQQQAKSSKSCNNPKQGGKGGKPKPQLNQMQQQLGKMLQQMQQQGKPGQQGQKQQLSEQFARMAAQQEAMRRELEKARRALEEQGKGEQAREIRQTEELMKEQERRLLNKQLDPAVMNRHREIETRLLEHEKAEREQEQDEQREAKRPPALPATPPPDLQAWMEQKRREQEALRRLPPELSEWYRQMLDAYYRQLR
ncbi:MAG: hypothetical protein KJS92_02770 [Bacteroidetes bacterium]|nr:hypothetical protein [Bacteroidota bacterium]